MAYQVGVKHLAVLRETVGAGLPVVHLAGERHQRPDSIAVILDVFLNREFPYLSRFTSRSLFRIVPRANPSSSPLFRYWTRGR